MPTGIGDNIRPVRDHYDKLFDLLDRGKLILPLRLKQGGLLCS